jgi:uncharacterized protein (DUF1697 family)
MTHIGLLRAVNLAGHNTVSMGALRDLLASVGMRNVRTLLQSGNAVFDSEVSPTEKLEALLERATGKRLGVNTEFFVRSADEWKAIIAANPFPQEAKADPARLVIVCLKRRVDRAAVAALQSAIAGRETVRAKGREAYITYPDGMGRSKLTTALIEKHLGCRGTARNWNTVLKLAAAAGAAER